MQTNSNRVALWGLLLVVLAAAAVMIFLFRAEIAASFGIAPPPCGADTLEINGQSYRIETVRRAGDGALTLPRNKAGRAFWVAGTTLNYVFFINDPALTVKGGAAKITWANCNSTGYILYGSEPGAPDDAAVFDQNTSDITLVIQSDAAPGALIATGSLIGEELNVIPTPDPDEMLAEISLLETTTSADRTTISVSVSIANYGQSAITVTDNEVALLVANAPTALPGSDPPLPKEIAPGATENFIFTFARPDAPTATLRVFSAEYELEGY